MFVDMFVADCDREGAGKFVDETAGERLRTGVVEG